MTRRRALTTVAVSVLVGALTGVAVQWVHETVRGVTEAAGYGPRR